jgi:hypothetical protein
MMKLIIAGSRTFQDYKMLERVCNKILSNTTEEEIIVMSGNASGADKLGEIYAEKKGYPIQLFKAEWDKYGKKAGFIRNREMAMEGTHLIAFWDGVSKGTESMIKLAEENKVITRVIKVNKSLIGSSMTDTNTTKVVNLKNETYEVYIGKGEGKHLLKDL